METKIYTLGTTEITVILDMMDQTLIRYTAEDGLIHEMILKTIVPQRYSRYISTVYNDRLMTIRGAIYEQKDIDAPSEEMFYALKDNVSTKPPLEAMERMSLDQMMMRLTGLHCMDANLDLVNELYNNDLDEDQMNEILNKWTYTADQGLTEIEI